jgi:hypothetical protein
MRSVFGRRVLGVLCAVFVLCGACGLILATYIHIRQNRGTEGWMNVYGQPGSWANAAGGLIALALIAVVVCLIVGTQIWMRSRQEGIPMRKLWRELRQRK